VEKQLLEEAIKKSIIDENNRKLKI